MSLQQIKLLGTLTPAIVREFGTIYRGTTKIDLLIDSDGGLTRRCNAIIGAIRQLKGYGVTINGVVVGKAYSAAFIILQECETRKATPLADLMFHAPAKLRLGGEGEPSFVDERNFQHPMYLEQIRILSERSGLPEATLQEWSAQERHFSAEEALQNRFIDEIVDSSCYGKWRSRYES